MQHLLDSYRLAVYLPYSVPQSVSLPREYTQLPINFDYKLQVECSLEESLLEKERQEITSKLDPLSNDPSVNQSTPTSESGPSSLNPSNNLSKNQLESGSSSQKNTPNKPTFDLSEFEENLPSNPEIKHSSNNPNSLKEDLAQLGEVLYPQLPKQPQHPVNIYQTLPPGFRATTPPTLSNQYGPLPPNAHILKNNISGSIPPIPPRLAASPPPLPPKSFSNSPPIVNTEYIDQLVNMGFNRPDVVKALEKFNNDLAQATNYLLDNSI